MVKSTIAEHVGLLTYSTYPQVISLFINNDVRSTQMKTHVETFLDKKDLGSKIPPYQPNFDFSGAFIDTYHQTISESSQTDNSLIQIKSRKFFGKVIPGWLRREDALKLYELAYFTKGDILELGPYNGLSTSILAKAVINSGQSKQICSVDLDSSYVKATMRNLRSMGLHKDVTVICDDAATAVKQFAAKNQRFGFIFIDHSHAYEPVYKVCRELVNITEAGTFCLFHDFNDARNNNPDNKDYGVYQAVIDGLDHSQFDFFGIYGCTGLYRVKMNS